MTHPSYRSRTMEEESQLYGITNLKASIHESSRGLIWK